MTDPGQSAEELFGEALELPPERRSAFLDQACRNAPELRRQVERLLEQDQQAGSFLANPVIYPGWLTRLRLLQALWPSPSRFQAGQLIADRFAIVRFIARGGMGEVYEAKDQFLQDATCCLENYPAGNRSRCHDLRTLSAGGRSRTQSGSFQPLSDLRDFSLRPARPSFPVSEHAIAAGPDACMHASRNRQSSNLARL